MLFTLVMTDTGLGFGLLRLVGGVAISLGLILLVVGGAELITGNSLIVMALAERRVSMTALLRNWLLVYIANAIGAGAMVILMLLADGHAPGGGAVA